MKILHLKYKMHKLVNLVFYLIIFIFGFLLGFSAEKVNFNKLISQFLFIDSVSAEEYIGKNFEVTSLRSPQSTMFHLTALLETDEDVVVGNVVKVIFKGTNCINVKSSEAYGANLSSDVSGDVSNSKYVESISPNTINHRQIVNGSNLEVIMQDRTLSKTPTTPYIKVPIMFYGIVPFSCDISELSITINGNEKEILKLGSFFSEEKFIISESSNNENPGGDNTGNENENPSGGNTGNENPGGDNNDQNVEIEISESTFYEFSQKIFGDVSEENKFIYDLITFSLVSLCFILFTLIIGYIVKKIFGG